MAKNRNNRRRRDRNNSFVVANPEPITAPQPVPFKVGIEPPPDHIFKHRRNRIAPAQEVWGHGTVSYAPTHAEYLEGKGCFVHYYGVPYPSKTVAPVEAIHASNVAKRILINLLRLWSSKEALFPLASLFLVGKKIRGKFLTRIFDYFNLETDTVATGFYLKDGYYCAFVKEIRKFAETLLISLGVEKETAIKTAEIMGMVFEYDNAYRFRLQDIMDSADPEKLLSDLPNEIDRLIALERNRENLVFTTETNSVPGKFKSAASFLRYGWYIPSFRKVIKKAIESINFDNCKFDEADLYHTYLYGDYNIRGKSIEERVNILKGMHGEDMSKWPPRIEIRQSR